MAAFPTLGAQQETNRKILEDLQLKKQLLQKGSLPGLSTGLTTAAINQVLYMPTTQLLVQPSEFSQGGAVATAPRSAFNPTSSTTLGFFIPQDSYYGNTFIPVLPRLEPLPPNHAAK